MAHFPPHRTFLKFVPAILAALLCWPSLWAEKVRVISDQAAVKLGDDVLAILKKGDEIAVISRKDNWLGVKVRVNQEEKLGWLHSRHVETIDEEKPAVAPAEAREPGEPKAPRPETRPEPAAMEEVTVKKVTEREEPEPGPAAVPPSLPLKLAGVQSDFAVMVRINGANPKLKGTALHSIWNEPETREFLAQPLAAMQQFTAQMSPMVGINVWDILPLLQTEVVFTLYGVETPEGQAPAPKAALAIRTDAAGSAADTAAHKLLDFLKLRAPQGAVQEVKAGDVNTLTIQFDGPPIQAAFLKDWFVAATGPGVFEALLADPASALPKDPVGRANPEALANDALITVFYNNLKTLQAIGGFIPLHARNEMKEVGLGDLNWAYVTLRPHGQGYKTTVAVASQGGRLPGALGILQTSGEPLSEALLASVPADCRFFSAASLDLRAGYDHLLKFTAAQGEKTLQELTEIIKRTEETVGFSIRDDLLASLGNELALVTRPGSYLFIPAFAGQLRLLDADKFDQCIGSLIQVANDALAKGRPPILGGGPVRLRISKTQFQDVTLNVLNFDNLPIPVSPCYVVAGDKLTFALFPHTLKDYLLYLKSGGPDIRSNQDFRFVRSQLPEQVSSLVYGDLKSTAASLYALLPMAVAALNGIPQNPVKFDPGKCPAWSTVSKHLFGTAAATYTTDEAMVYEVYSPLILPIASGDASMGSLATTSIMAGMLLPALARARGEARAMKCKNNLRQLATASIQYIDQYGKGRCYPKSLAEIYTSKLLTVPDLFRCPDGQAPTKLAEGVMTSYESAFDRAGAEYQFADRTPSNQIMIWEKEPCHKGRRNVAYFDAHVESMDEQGFQGALKKLDKHIADEKAAKAKPKE